MCQLSNSLIPHQITKIISEYSILLRPFGISLEEKNMNPYLNIESIKNFNRIYSSHKYK